LVNFHTAELNEIKKKSLDKYTKSRWSWSLNWTVLGSSTQLLQSEV